jgi:hypothetical protein
VLKVFSIEFFKMTMKALKRSKIFNDHFIRFSTVNIKHVMT